MKKRGLMLALVILLSSLVAANGGAGLAADISTVIDKFVSAVEPVASAVLGATPTGQYLFAKVLFLIIILAVVFTALNRIDFFNENTWVLWLISIAASILATRWLTTEAIIATIILPYSTLGVAISAGLPFILYFLVVNVGFARQPAIVRRIAWIFFAVIFIGLWITRYDSLQEAIWIYPITALVAFIMAVMDGTVHRFFVKLNLEKLGRASSVDAITDLKQKISELPNLVRDDIITQQEADRRKRDYRKKIAFLSK